MPTLIVIQNPNAIEHETPPSGDTYAVVDKPKKKEPDVVPVGTEGVSCCTMLSLMIS